MSPKVLIANNDKHITRLVSTNLVRHGFTVVTSERDVALERAKQEKPDIAILDAAVVSLDNVETVNSFRSDSETADMPIVILADQVSEDEWESRVDGIVTKPFSPELLVEVVIGIIVNHSTSLAERLIPA